MLTDKETVLLQQICDLEIKYSSLQEDYEYLQKAYKDISVKLDKIHEILDLYD